MAARQEPGHLAGQAGSAFLRVARRLGVVPEISEAGPSDASELGWGAVAFDRVEVRLFGDGASVAVSDADAVPAVALVRVDARRFGAATVPVGAAETSPTWSSAAVEAAGLAVDAARPAGPRRVVARRFGATSDDAVPAAAAETAADSPLDGEAVGAGRGAAFGDWASWARSISWSSSGTSLHGSLERAGRSERSGRSWRSNRSGRSPRPNAGSAGRPPPLERPPGTAVLPLTSG